MSYAALGMDKKLMILWLCLSYYYFSVFTISVYISTQFPLIPKLSLCPTLSLWTLLLQMSSLLLNVPVITGP